MADDIADGIGWEGESQKLIDSLVVSGFLDIDNGVLVVHEWMDYAGKLIEKRNAAKERKKAERAANKKRRTEDVPGTYRGRTSDGAGSHSRTVPDPTVPDPTVPDPTVPDTELIEETNTVPEKQPPKKRTAKRPVEMDGLFLDSYSAYPKKSGKTDSYEVWQQRVKEGDEPSFIKAGIERYLEVVWYSLPESERETRHIKNFQTLIGPKRHFAEFAEMDTDRVKELSKNYRRPRYGETAQPTSGSDIKKEAEEMKMFGGDLTAWDNWIDAGRPEDYKRFFRV